MWLYGFRSYDGVTEHQYPGIASGLIAVAVTLDNLATVFQRQRKCVEDVYSKGPNPFRRIPAKIRPRSG